MKTNPIYLACVLILIGTGLFAQNPVEDALVLQANIKNDGRTLKSNDTVRGVLAKYAPTETTIANVVRSFNTNPYISQSATTPIAIPGGLSGSSPSNGLTSFLSDVGGMNVTAIADGFARFLVKRAKEEMAINFFDRMREALRSVPGLQELFPATFDVLDTIGDEIYEYQRFWATLRQAFEKDLSNLYDNLLELLRNSSLSGPILALIEQAVTLGQDLLNGIHPGDILHTQAGANWTGMGLDPNVEAAIQTLDFVSQCLRSKDDQRYWLPYADIRKLNNNGIRLCLGLMWQQLNNSGGGPTFTVNGTATTLQTLLSNIATVPASIDQWYDAFEAFALKAENCHRTIQNVVDSDGKTDFSRVLPVFESFTAILAHVNELTGLPGMPAAFTNTTFDDFLEGAEDLMEIVADVKGRKYASAVLGVVQLIGAYIPNGDLEAKLLKYGTFIATVAEAETAEEVEAAIEAAVLPAGSARIKKESVLNLSIQSYLGLNYLDVPDQSNLARIKGKLGVYAPVGISGSAGFKLLQQRWSLSAFVSVFDVGGIAAFRFVEADSAIKGDITAGNIFSPGLNVALGLPKVPIAIGAGYQAGPRLQRINEGVPELSENNAAWGLHYFIVVDIPLFNLATRTRRD